MQVTLYFCLHRSIHLVVKIGDLPKPLPLPVLPTAFAPLQSDIPRQRKRFSHRICTSIHVSTVLSQSSHSSSKQHHGKGARVIHTKQQYRQCFDNYSAISYVYHFLASFIFKSYNSGEFTETPILDAAKEDKQSSDLVSSQHKEEIEPASPNLITSASETQQEAEPESTFNPSMVRSSV